MQTESVIKYLAELFCVLNKSNPNDLVNGSSLNLHFKLRCPITNEIVEFGDFDSIAFCPQANNLDDPLYDPMVSAPYPCVNITSDIFVFSLFTSDMSLQNFGKNVYDLAYDERNQLFHSVEQIL